MAKAISQGRRENTDYQRRRYQNNEGRSTRAVKSAREARQGYWDPSIMWVLTVSLILCVIAFFGLWLWARF